MKFKPIPLGPAKCNLCDATFPAPGESVIPALMERMGHLAISHARELESDAVLQRAYVESARAMTEIMLKYMTDVNLLKAQMDEAHP